MKLSDGAGLPSYSTLYTTLAAGVPLIVSGIRPGDSNLTPEYFIRRYGKERVTVVNTMTGGQRIITLSNFMDSFANVLATPEPEKLKVLPVSVSSRIGTEDSGLASDGGLQKSVSRDVQVVRGGPGGT